MSEKGETPIVSDSKQQEEHELTKEERLEAARKKFEELKKKKKNKKKKSKKDKEDKNEDDVSENESKDIESAEQSSTVEESKEDLAHENDTTEESQKEESAKEATELKYENQEPEPVHQEIEEADNMSEKGLLKEELKESEEPKESPLQESAPAESSANGEEIELLKATIDQQKNTIKKLRDENTDLKLSKMDLRDKIAELEKTISKLMSSSITTSQVSDVVVPSSKSPIKPAKPVFTTNDYASMSQQNFSKFNQTGNFREMLMVWKGWQVDMSNWNGSNQTQKIAL